MSSSITKKDIEDAHERVRSVAKKTPLELHAGLSKKYGARIYLKREDLQAGRSYKLRGAYNRIAQFTEEEKRRGAVCASAGNHAQGFAYSCHALGIDGVVYMPRTAPKQKVERVQDLGDGRVTIKLIGDTFDEAHKAACEHVESQGSVLVHPFNDPQVIAGQGTIGVELLQQLGETELDYVVVPVGGGGLASGVGTYISHASPHTKMIGVEPTGAASMKAAFDAGKVVALDRVDTFADGVAVKRVGELTYSICRDVLSDLVVVPEGKICETMIDLYQKDGIVAEPSGALSVAALDTLADAIHGKTVVCVISGGNNDICRYTEVMERYRVYKGSEALFV